MSPEEETVLSNWLAKGKSSSDVPAAPFKDDYAALELKKQLAQAIESGDEFLAWTPGEEQIGRYSGALKQQVDRITWIKNENGTYSVYPIKRGLPVQIEGTENLDAKGLRNLIGKEMADKIMSTEPEMINKAGEVGGELTGDNLTIGGAGMRHFYDTVMRREAEKLAKQYGGELTEASFHNVREPWHIVREDDPNYIVQSFDSKDLADKWLARMHERGVGAVLKVRGVEPLKTPAIRITDKMRENFKKAGGFPLYGVAGAAALAPDDWMSAFEPD